MTLEFRNDLINAMLIRYKTKILDLIEIWRFNEDVSGHTCKQYNVSKYLLAIILTNEVNDDYQEGTLTWDAIVAKWDLLNKRKIFLSYNINLNALFTDINLPSII